MNKGFIRRIKDKVIDGQSKEIKLKGVNFGGWLMMEAYFMQSPHQPQQLFEKEFSQKCGPKALAELLKRFRNSFITESDFKQVASWGMNCIRLPFHYKIAADPHDIKYLDQAIAWARKHKVYLIMDLHAAPGAQNPDWHSDSLNRKTEFWTKRANRQKTCELWEKIADRYKDETIIAGYDLLNESVLNNVHLLNEFYGDAIKAIRQHDRNHMLFIEGDFWAQNIDVLDDFEDDNWIYSIHFYEPMEYAFNLIPYMHYPWKTCNKETIRKRMEGYFKFAKDKQRPVHVGEFGVNYRNGFANEHHYLRDELKAFNDFGFHWSYWPYKAVKNYTFPDGVYSYYPNSPWVNRMGPNSGWLSWSGLWDKYKDEMTASWRTKEFQLNTLVWQELKKAL